MEDLFKLIKKLAEVPSFSTYEDVLHPEINRIAQQIKGCKVHMVPDFNMILEIPGKKKANPVALAAHLDKINHFGENPPEKLPVVMGTTYLEGLLDDSAGLGIILKMAQEWENNLFPPLFLLLSEMEESTGLKKHPHLLRNGGEGVEHGMGAQRICRYLRGKKIDLQAVITVDTTPIFRGEYGVAVYGRHWEFTHQEPSQEELELTENLCNAVLEIDPMVVRSNNTNDYLQYGEGMNTGEGHPVPSIALEPAIYPYHQANERVYYSDIERVYHLLRELLRTYF